MKSRIINPVPKMCIGVKLPKEKSEKLSVILGAEGVELVLADDNCGEQQVGYLCGFNGFSKSDESVAADSELIIFSGIDNKTLNRIITAMRVESCRVELKAVATMHNRCWTVNALAAELFKEHCAMKEYKRMKAGSDDD